MASTVTVSYAAPQRNEISERTESHGSTTSVIDHPGLWVRAFAREGLSGYQAAAVLGWSEPQYAKAFSHNYPDQNVAMKRLSLLVRDERVGEVRDIVRRVNRAYASLVAEANGLEIGVLSEEVEHARKFTEAFSTLVRSVR